MLGGGGGAAQLMEMEHGPSGVMVVLDSITAFSGDTGVPGAGATPGSGRWRILPVVVVVADLSNRWNCWNC